MSFEMEQRLNQVLQLFLSPDYDIASTSYFDLLLSHIAENTSKRDLNQHKIYESWILKAVQTWESRNEKPRQGIITFTLKLVGIIGQDELCFQSLNQNDTFNRLCKIFQLDQANLSASVKMAYITMLCNFTGHHSGRQWIIETEMWRTIIEFAHSNHTMYITRECKNFLITFLNSEQANVELCEKIVMSIAEPLITRTVDTKIIPAMEDSYMDQNRVLCATLDLITNIIEDTLFVSLDNSVPYLFERVISLEIRVKALFEACLSTRFLHYVHKLLILIIFMKLKQGLNRETNSIDEQIKEQFRHNIHYVSFKLLSKKFLLDVMKTFKMSLVYWKKLRAICDFPATYKYRLETQAIAVMVLPLSACLKKAYNNCELFDTFLNKMFDITCVEIQRLAYNIRDILLKEEVDVETVCKSSVEITLEIINIMDRDIAVIAFQTMCHVLKNYTMENEEVKPDESEGKRKKYKSLLDGDPISQAPALLSTLLDGLVTMTEKFKLKWPECVETICVLSHAQKIVSHPAVTPKTCVKALKLFKLAIENFMPPNLVLLVDSESHMSEVGATLYKRLHDPNWEIQDSVLEVLNTIAVISEHKYPAYQQFLLEKDFLQVAVDLITSDGDSYVRASAFTFIRNTIRINQLWDEKLSKCDLLELAIKSINDEDEAIVRREAVALINELYIHRRWNKSKLDAMTQAMATAVLYDLHWEVKVNGLKFWKNVIYTHLTDQGMLDGSFPNVTFSKEHKKIVSLDETEIKQRLNKVLDELAKQNCLGVLLAALKDESDLEVCKTSAQILSMFKKILTKYKVNEPQADVPLPKDSATIDSVYVKQNQPKQQKLWDATLTKSEDVIEDIVVDNDTNLLNSIYINTIRGSNDATKSKESFDHIQCVTKDSFLQTIFNYDFNAYIKEKDSWLKNYTNSFESILEDILTVYHSEVNLMDCY